MDAQLALPKNMPNVWGRGQLFAFSALDGRTDWNEPFVLHTADKPGSLTVRLPLEVNINFSDLPEVHFSLILGDVIAADTPTGNFIATFLDHHTLIGQLPLDAAMVVDDRTIGTKPVPLGNSEDLTLWAATGESRFAIKVTSDTNSPDLTDAFTADIIQTANDRSSFVRKVKIPAHLDDSQARLLRKAVSIMKVNVESACGQIKRRWTTPDRWPHRHMWLWDSAFHALGLSRIDPDLARDALLAVLEQTKADGMLPHTITPVTTSQITQPPILAWAVLEILNVTGDRNFAQQCKPYLFQYLEWDRKNRDQNGNHIPEWFIEGNPLCRCGECGLDNSPLFDKAVLLDSVDFACYLCNDYMCLAEIAERLSDDAMSKTCRTHAQKIKTAVNDLLWCEEMGLYLYRDFDGDFVPIKTIASFMPLFAGVADDVRARRLLAHLQDPATFAAPMPIPSVALDSGSYCKDMWRGPSWINTNYLIYRGLVRYGFTEAAARLRTVTIDKLNKWYLKEGCLFENYDSLDLTSPHDLDRKQRLVSGRGLPVISDLQWSAAVTARLIMDGPPDRN